MAEGKGRRLTRRGFLRWATAGVPGVLGLLTVQETFFWQYTGQTICALNGIEYQYWCLVSCWGNACEVLFCTWAPIGPCR